MLGEIEYKALRKQVVSTCGSTSTKVRDFFSSPKALASRFKLAHKIKNIRERLAEVVAEKDQFNLTERLEDGHVVHRRDMTHSFVHPSTVIGSDNDKKKDHCSFDAQRYQPKCQCNTYSWIGRFGEDHACQVGVQRRRCSWSFSVESVGLCL